MAITEETSLPIIIAGTGPAALLLAHALLRATPPLPFHLYERYLSMMQRAQGYRFRITARGVRSCYEVLSPEHFALLRATCGDNPAVATKQLDARTGATLNGVGTTRHQQLDEPLTADRTLMRQVLFKGLEPYTTFSKEIIGFEEAASDSGVLVRFADGSTMHGALLVGADGTFSRVRAQLAPRVQLLDSGLRMIFGKTPLTPSFYAAMGLSGEDDPRCVELLKGLTLPSPEGSPMFFMFEAMRFGGRAAVAIADSVLAASIPEDYVYWIIALRSDQSEAQRINWRSMGGSVAADLAEDLIESWLPSMRALATHQDRTKTIPLRSAVMSIPLANWRTSSAAPDANSGVNGSNYFDPMVTLIGDAAHAMPPTGGLGATTALTDAAVLGAALTAHGNSRRALDIYETEMRDYASQAIEKSLQGGKMFVNMRDLEEMEPIEY